MMFESVSRRHIADFAIHHVITDIRHYFYTLIYMFTFRFFDLLCRASFIAAPRRR